MRDLNTRPSDYKSLALPGWANEANWNWLQTYLNTILTDKLYGRFIFPKVTRHVLTAFFSLFASLLRLWYISLMAFFLYISLKVLLFLYFSGLFPAVFGTCYMDYSNRTLKYCYNQRNMEIFWAQVLRSLSDYFSEQARSLCWNYD